MYAGCSLRHCAELSFLAAGILTQYGLGRLQGHLQKQTPQICSARPNVGDLWSPVKL